MLATNAYKECARHENAGVDSKRSHQSRARFRSSNLLPSQPESSCRKSARATRRGQRLLTRPSVRPQDRVVRGNTWANHYQERTVRASIRTRDATRYPTHQETRSLPREVEVLNQWHRLCA